MINDSIEKITAEIRKYSLDRWGATLQPIKLKFIAQRWGKRLARLGTNSEAVIGTLSEFYTYHTKSGGIVLLPASYMDEVRQEGTEANVYKMYSIDMF